MFWFVLYMDIYYCYNFFFFFSKIFKNRYCSLSYLFILWKDYWIFYVSKLLHFYSRHLFLSFFNKEFLRFLIWFSVRPLRIFASSDHFLPIFYSVMIRVRSSSIDQSDLLRLGSRWLFHLSLHYFPCLNIFELVIIFNSIAILHHFFTDLLLKTINN